MKCFKWECVHMEGITTCNTGYCVLILWKQRNITSYCIVSGNHRTVIAAHPLCLTSKNFLGHPFQHTQIESCRHIKSHTRAIIHSVWNSFLCMVSHNSVGLKLPDFIALPVLMPTRWKKKKRKKKDPHTSLNGAWQQGWVMLNHINIKPNI